MHPILRERRALLAYLAAWLLASYLPASVLAAPGGPRVLVALAVAAPATVLLGLGALPIHDVCRALPLGSSPSRGPAAGPSLTRRAPARPSPVDVRAALRRTSSGIPAAGWRRRRRGLIVRSTHGRGANR